MNPATTPIAGQHNLQQQWNNPMYQRNTSNPRASAYDPTGQSAGAGTTAGDDQYAGYQQTAAGFSNVGVGGYNYSGMSNLYNTASPSLPSGSRRTSGGKAGTPPASAPAAGTNASPSTYYSSRQQATTDVNSPAQLAHQSPYQPASAPPQVLSHHNPSLSASQQHQQYNAYYQNYYDQQQSAHHQSSGGGGGSSGGQWQTHYSAPSQFAQPSVQQRQTSTGSVSAPSVGVTDAPHSSRASGTFDYSATAAPSQYQSWDPSSSRPVASNQWQQQQQAAAAQQQHQPRVSGGSGQAPSASSPWQGYGSHHPLPPPPVPVPQMGGQLPPGQYGWNQWGGQGYYPPTHPAAPQAPPPVAAAAAAAQQQPAAHPVAAAPKKSKSKKDALAVAPVESILSHKRPADSGPEDEVERKDKSKGKKSKKEEEKPVPKPPAKSHLHPPRQASSAWQLYFTDELNKAKAIAAAEAGTTPGGTPIHPKLNVAQIAKDAGATYAALDDERKAYYAAKVEEGKVQYAKELVAWQATLTPDDIKAENAFRAQQRKEGKSRKGNLKDPNAPKKPLSAYFLFLKGIRENDELRKQVWGEETETTRQSVLAAERWRGLNDEEKRPYLQQAEKDKGEYETMRKLYEDDAAARARGETVPDRPHYDIVSTLVDPPKSLLEPRKDVKVKIDTAADSATPVTAVTTGNPTPVTGVSATAVTGGATDEPATATTSGAFDSAGLEIDDEFHGFDAMDLAGLAGITGDDGTHDNQWGDLQTYMKGDAPNGASATNATAPGTLKTEETGTDGGEDKPDAVGAAAAEDEEADIEQGEEDIIEDEDDEDKGDE